MGGKKKKKDLNKPLTPGEIKDPEGTKSLHLLTMITLVRITRTSIMANKKKKGAIKVTDVGFSMRNAIKNQIETDPKLQLIKKKYPPQAYDYFSKDNDAPV